MNLMVVKILKTTIKLPILWQQSADDDGKASPQFLWPQIKPSIHSLSLSQSPSSIPHGLVSVQKSSYSVKQQSNWK